MKALSVRQPWAWLIAHGYKDVENRSWSTKFRGRVYIHAGKLLAWSWLASFGVTRFRAEMPETFEQLQGFWRFMNDTGHLGAIVGEVDIVDCVTRSTSFWFEGPYGFVLANPVTYEKPIPYKGRLGLFNVLDLPEAGEEALRA